MYLYLARAVLSGRILQTCLTLAGVARMPLGNGTTAEQAERGGSL